MIMNGYTGRLRKNSPYSELFLPVFPRIRRDPNTGKYGPE